jgi:phosphatidylserine decarboxylase
MAEVSGIVNSDSQGNPIVEGQRVEKGQLIGMFRFGGSSHCFIFDRNIKGLEFNDSIYQRVENAVTGVNESVLQKVRTPLAFVSKAK